MGNSRRPSAYTTATGSNLWTCTPPLRKCQDSQCRPWSELVISSFWMNRTRLVSPVVPYAERLFNTITAWIAMSKLAHCLFGITFRPFSQHRRDQLTPQHCEDVCCLAYLPDLLRKAFQTTMTAIEKDWRLFFSRVTTPFETRWTGP